MRAVVLVGGEGTRLRPLTLTAPKQMLPIVEQPMIERVIGHLAEHGIDEAVLSLGYRPDAFINAYPDGTIAGVRLSYAVEPTPLDTAGAIRFAARHAGIDDTFVVVNGDVLTDADTSALVAFHRRRGAEATISLTPVDDPSAFGVVPTDGEGRVTAFIEKPPRDEAPDRPDQRRDLCPRAVGSRADPAPTNGSPSSVRPFRPWSRRARSSPCARTPTGSTPARPTPTCGPTATSSSGAGPARPRPGAELDPSLGTGVWRMGKVDVRSDQVSHSLIGNGALVAAEAVVEESVIGAGAVVEEGASIIRLGAHARRPGGIQGGGGGIGDRARGHRRPAVCDPRPLGDRRRRGHRLGDGHRRPADRPGV